jgi:hypothetical protein
MNHKELYKLIVGTALILAGFAAFSWWSDETAAAALKEWLYLADIVVDHHHEVHRIYLPLIFR